MKAPSKYKWLICTLLTWIILFAVPTFRYHLKVMAEGSPWIHFTILPSNYWQYRFDMYSPSLPIKNQAIKSGGTIYGSLSNPNILKPIDAIIHEHPDVTWLIAARL